MKDTGKVESCRVAAAEKIVFISMFFSILIDRVLQSFNLHNMADKIGKMENNKTSINEKESEY